MSLSSMILSSSHLVAPREMNVVKPKSAIPKVIVIHEAWGFSIISWKMSTTQKKLPSPANRGFTKGIMHHFLLVRFYLEAHIPDRVRHDVHHGFLGSSVVIVKWWSFATKIHWFAMVCIKKMESAGLINDTIALLAVHCIVVFRKILTNLI